MTRTVAEAVVAISGSLPLSLAVKATGVIALALVGTRIARRSPASVRHLVLAAAFITLLALPLVALIAPSIQVEVPLLEHQRASASAAVTPDAEHAAISPMAAASHKSSGPRRSFQFSTLIATTWVVGTVLFLLPVAAGLWQLRCIRRFGVPWVRGEVILREVANEIGIQRRVGLLLHDAIPGPMTYGILRPAIVFTPD